MVVLKKIIFLFLFSFALYRQLQSTEASTNSHLYSHSSSTANGTSAISTSSNASVEHSVQEDKSLNEILFNEQINQKSVNEFVESEVKKYNLGEKIISEIYSAFNNKSGEVDYLIGIQYYRGIAKYNNKSRMKLAFSQFIKSAKKDFPDALVMIYKMLHLGLGNFDELKKDLSWLEKMALLENLVARKIFTDFAAKLINPYLDASQTDYYDFFKDPNLYPSSEELFIQLRKLKHFKSSSGLKLAITCKCACEKGSVDAPYFLSQLYASGMHVSKDLNLAFKYAEIAAKRGNIRVLPLLGKMYHFGIGVDADAKKSKEIEYRAACLGFSDTQFNCGIDCILQNIVQGMNWFKLSASQGNHNSLLMLGMFKQYGIDENCRLVEPNYNEAFECYQLAAQRGSYGAMYQLAVHFYKLGLADKKDIESSRKLFHQILISRDPDSSLYKGYMYEFGYGIKKDLDAAKQFYTNCTCVSATERIKHPAECEERKKKKLEQKKTRKLKEREDKKSEHKSSDEETEYCESEDEESLYCRRQFDENPQ